MVDCQGARKRGTETSSLRVIKNVCPARLTIDGSTLSKRKVIHSGDARAVALLVFKMNFREKDDCNTHGGNVARTHDYQYSMPKRRFLKNNKNKDNN